MESIIFQDVAGAYKEANLYSS